MRPDGFSWVFLCPYKFLCTFMGTYGSKWVRMRPYCSLLVLISPWRSLLVPMLLYASIWVLMCFLLFFCVSMDCNEFSCVFISPYRF